jgi:hypothetical protein
VHRHLPLPGTGAVGESAKDGGAGEGGVGGGGALQFVAELVE